MPNVLIDTSPLANAHSIRGVGTYTRFLTEYLEKIPDLTVRRSTLLDGEKFSPDIIHFPYFDFYFPTLPLLKKAKTVVTIHDTIPLVFPDHYPVGKKGQMAFIKQKLALKLVEGVITDSQASKGDIEKYLGVPAAKIHVVPLAANPQLQAADEALVNRIRRKLKLPKHYILYVGDINYNKNLPQLIKALKFLPEPIKLVMVGKNFEPQDIPEWKWIETQLALSDVKDRVKFFADVLSDDIDALSALYSGAICYVQPSLYEGFGLPVLEAMTCKTPVVSTKTSSLPEVGGDWAIYTETHAESLAEGIEHVLNWTKTARATHIRSAYKWSQQFSWEKTATATQAVYSQILATS